LRDAKKKHYFMMLVPRNAAGYQGFAQSVGVKRCPLPLRRNGIYLGVESGAVIAVSDAGDGARRELIAERSVTEEPYSLHPMRNDVTVKLSSMISSIVPARGCHDVRVIDREDICE
jgi:hypothetical protein